jgi:hypothetical protein
LILLRLPWLSPFYWLLLPGSWQFCAFEGLTTAAIALLFFMHGAKLSREAIIAGGGHWRLHLWVMCSTFILFPILGVLFAWWRPSTLILLSILVSSIYAFCRPPFSLQLHSHHWLVECCCGLFGISLQSVGHFRLTAAGRPVDEYARCRRQSGAGG